MTHQRLALIVGGNSGMGLATSRKLLEAGSKVIIAGRSETKLQNAVEQLSHRVEAIAVDATSEASVNALFESTGTIDDLIITVGSGVPMGAFSDVGIDGLEQTITSKLLAQARIARAAIPHLTISGSITFVSGLAGRRPIEGMSAVAVANQGIEALATILAKELAPQRVNVVAPGLVDTPAYDEMPANARQAMMESAAKALPVGRVGTSDDIAEVIVAIVSNGFITGSVFEIDGGFHL